MVVAAVDTLEVLGVAGYDVTIKGAVDKWLPGTRSQPDFTGGDGPFAGGLPVSQTRPRNDRSSIRRGESGSFVGNINGKWRVMFRHFI